MTGIILDNVRKQSNLHLSEYLENYDSNVFCKDRLKSWLIVLNIWFRLISEWRIKPHCFNPIIWKESNADQKWPIWSIMKRKISFLLLTLSRTVFNLQNSKNILNNLIIFWNEPTLFYCLIDKAKITAQRILRLLY